MHLVLFIPSWPSLVHTGNLSAVTIPAGAHSVVVKEDPFSASNYFGRSPLVSLREHYATPPSVAVWWVGWSTDHTSSTFTDKMEACMVWWFNWNRHIIAAWHHNYTYIHLYVCTIYTSCSCTQHCLLVEPECSMLTVHMHTALLSRHPE